MDLLLWRHAEAEDGFPDLQRKLTPRGEKQAKQMAAWLKAHAPNPLRIIASPALRTQQTARALGLPFATDERLRPDAGVVDLLAAAGWPDGSREARDEDSTASAQPGENQPARNERKRAVLIVGHQPTLGRVAALLLAGQEADWSVKKGALWWFSNRVRQGETQTVLRAVIGAENCL